MDNDLGKLLIILGLILACIGLFLAFAGKSIVPGRLPGDIRIDRGNFTFFFPLGTCLLISLLISLFFWFFKR